MSIAKPFPASQILTEVISVDTKSPLTSSPVSDPSIVIDAPSNHLHPPSGRGHHRKASSLSAHITPRSRPTSVGHESPWTGEWKEGKEW